MIVRRTLLLTGLGALTGCGFHPVYGGGGGSAGMVSADLAAIRVDLIPERAGQLLRQDLQQRFEGTGVEVPKLYTMKVLLALAQEGIGIQPDNTASRNRFTAAATYVVRRQDATETYLVSGSARRVDAENVIDNQYFAADLEGETITRRLMAGIADQITLQLAAWFRAHPQPATAAPQGSAGAVAAPGG